MDITGSTLMMISDSSIDDYDITQYISSEYSTMPLPSMTIMTQLLTKTEDNCSECKLLQFGEGIECVAIRCN